MSYIKKTLNFTYMRKVLSLQKTENDYFLKKKNPSPRYFNIRNSGSLLKFLYFNSEIYLSIQMKQITEETLVSLLHLLIFLNLKS